GQVIMTPGKGGIEQPSRRQRGVIARHPIARAVRHFAEGGIAERGQGLIWRKVGFARRVAENRGLDRIPLVQLPSQLGCIVICDLWYGRVRQSRETSDSVLVGEQVVGAAP